MAGGVIVARNATNPRDQLLDFMQGIKTYPQVKTTFAEPGSAGFSVSSKLPTR